MDDLNVDDAESNQNEDVHTQNSLTYSLTFPKLIHILAFHMLMSDVTRRVFEMGVHFI